MSEQSPVITLDGPGGAGKGTLAGLLSDWLGWSLLRSQCLCHDVCCLSLARRAAKDLGELTSVARTLPPHDCLLLVLSVPHAVG